MHQAKARARLIPSLSTRPSLRSTTEVFECRLDALCCAAFGGSDIEGHDRLRRHFPPEPEKTEILSGLQPDPEFGGRWIERVGS